MGAFFISLINSLIKGLAVAIGAIFFLFPNSPFGNPAEPPETINLGWITWVLDFPTWLVHLTALTGAIGTYYLVRVAARWLKAVRS
ncbi:hypothetical protein [Schinkia azotoformans]|uniref:hypothetical protein n=1 Tax=Schinkia azotoformans TaxID=1454 RepID=UPI003D2D52FE